MKTGLILRPSGQDSNSASSGGGGGNSNGETLVARRGNPKITPGNNDRHNNACIFNILLKCLDRFFKGESFCFGLLERNDWHQNEESSGVCEEGEEEDDDEEEGKPVLVLMGGGEEGEGETTYDDESRSVRWNWRHNDQYWERERPDDDDSPRSNAHTSWEALRDVEGEEERQQHATPHNRKFALIKKRMF